MKMIWLYYIVGTIFVNSKLGFSELHDVSRSDKAQLFVLIIDAMSWDLMHYSQKNASPLGVEKMRINGAYVKSVKPVFPAECHPNIFSMFSGANPIDHGVLFTQPPHMRIGLKNSKVKNLWDFALEKNKTMRLFHFPMCADEKWLCEPYDIKHMTSSGLNRTMMNVLDQLENKKLDIAVVYYDELDRASHKFGPKSDLIINQTWPRLNGIIDYFLDQSGVRLPNLNILITSDHGMTDVRDFITLDRMIRLPDYSELVNRGSSVWIWYNQTDSTPHYHHLLSQENSQQFRVFNQSTFPSNWYYRHQSDLPPDGHHPVVSLPSIIVLAQPGYVFHSQLVTSQSDPWIRNYPNEFSNLSIKGMHGYDPSVADMHVPLFVQSRHAIHRGAFMDQLNMTDIYYLILYLTQLSVDNKRPLAFDNLLLFHPEANSWRSTASRWLGSIVADFSIQVGILIVTCLIVALLFIRLCRHCYLVSSSMVCSTCQVDNDDSLEETLIGKTVL